MKNTYQTHSTELYEKGVGSRVENEFPSVRAFIFGNKFIVLESRAGIVRFLSPSEFIVCQELYFILWIITLELDGMIIFSLSSRHVSQSATNYRLVNSFLLPPWTTQKSVLSHEP